MKKLVVHAWEITGYVKIDKELRDLIRNELRKNYGAMYKAEKLLGFSEYHHRLMYKRFKKINILFNLATYARIPFTKVEKHIRKWTDSTYKQCVYRVKFPVRINPLHLRIASHVIGDGSVHKVDKYEIYTWIQKSTKPMKELQKMVIGRSLKSKSRITGGEKIGIPKFIMKLVCSALKIDVNNFNPVLFLDSCLKLRKEFRIQALTALIEDEATMDYNRIIIRMKSKEIIELIARLIDSLGYRRNEISSYHERNKWTNEEFDMHKVSISLPGAQKYFVDLEELKRKYGNIAGLWKKNKGLERMSKMTSTLIGHEKNIYLSNLLMKIMKKSDIIRLVDVVNLFYFTWNDAASLLRYMFNKQYIIKVSKGLYYIVGE